MGFTKNPDLITYYAVKGEAQFIGLFNPFKSLPINLKAYAAAKPFGGRIGPAIFSSPDNTSVRARTSGEKKILRLYFRNRTQDFLVDQYGDPITDSEKFLPGMPLPLNFGTDNFWLIDDGPAIGGLRWKYQCHQLWNPKPCL